MADSGSGVGVPVAGGVPGSGTVVNPLPYTLLSLPRYARIMGINPVHFAGAVGIDVFPLKNNHCSDVWVRESYQYSDHVSHRDLAQSIYDAEWEIARVLGYHPAPRWTSKEMHRYPPSLPTSRRVYGPVGINARYGKIIQAGRRAVTLVGTATVAGGSLVYQDNDGDNFYETAQITLATSLSDVCEIKVYFTGKDGRQEWEIRPHRSKEISGGFVVLTFDSWLFIDPELLGAYPTSADFEAVNVETTANYVTSVDVYREYTDSTVASAEFSWSGNGGFGSLWPTAGSCCSGDGCCAVCGTTTQSGCMGIKDTEAGIVVPYPATYDSDAGVWNGAAWSLCDTAAQVKLWYYAGDVDEYFLRGDSCEPLSDFWAQTIAWIATCRLEREFCSCSNVNALADNLREDLSRSGSEASYQIDFSLLGNPFGTRRGEVMAWKRISRLSTPILYDAVAVL